MQWSDYVARLMGGSNQVEVEARTGVTQSTLSRWRSGKHQPSIESAVEFARMMPNGNPVEALVVLGVIRPSELSQPVHLGTSADDLTNGELVTTLARRLGVDMRRQEVRGA